MAYFEAYGSPINKRSRANRGPAFHDYERQLLFRLVNNYRSIIDNNDNSRFMMAEKMKIWETIVSIFNSSPQIQLARTIVQVRDFYENTLYYYKKRGLVPGGLVAEDIIVNHDNIIYQADENDYNNSNEPVVLNDFERSQLIHLVEERQAILGNKSNVELAFKAKRLAWTEITNVFNSVMRAHTNEFRTRSELERAYCAHKQATAPDRGVWTGESAFRKLGVRDNGENSSANKAGESSGSRSNDTSRRTQLTTLTSNESSTSNSKSNTADEDFRIPDKAVFKETEKTFLIALVNDYDEFCLHNNRKRSWPVITEKFNEAGISAIPRTKEQLANLFYNEHVRKKNAGHTSGGDGDLSDDSFNDDDRRRSTFSEAEKDFLISLVNDYDKFNPNKQKRQWNTIAEKFNEAGLSSQPRSKGQLCSLFGNMQQIAKKGASGDDRGRRGDDSDSDPSWEATKSKRRSYDDDCKSGKAMFRRAEKKLLLSLVKDYDENSSNSKKKRPWAVIAEKFNEAGISPIPRTRDQLANLFYNENVRKKRIGAGEDGQNDNSTEREQDPAFCELDNDDVEGRRSVFSEEEKALLNSVVADYDLYKRDGQSRSWTVIADKFNEAGISPVRRKKDQLYALHNNMHQQLRKASKDNGEEQDLESSFEDQPSATYGSNDGDYELGQGGPQLYSQQVILDDVERDQLLQLIAERQHIFQDESNTESSNQAKRNAWTEVTHAFNSTMVESTGVIRTERDLQRAYGADTGALVGVAEAQHEKQSVVKKPVKRVLTGDKTWDELIEEHEDKKRRGTDEQEQDEEDSPARIIFKSAERRLLLSLVKVYDKSRHGVKKTRTWNVITRKFNASGVSDVHRTKAQLRSLFNNERHSGKVRKGGKRKRIDQNKTFSEVNHPWTRKSATKEKRNKQNFTPGERNYFQTLLHNFKDFDDSEDKSWKKLTVKFNKAGLYTIRTTSQLRVLYSKLMKDQTTAGETVELEDDELQYDEDGNDFNIVGEDESGNEAETMIEFTFKCPLSLYGRFIKQKDYGGFVDDSSFLDHLLRHDEALQPQMESNDGAGSGARRLKFIRSDDEMDYDDYPAAKVDCCISEGIPSPSTDPYSDQGHKSSSKSDERPGSSQDRPGSRIKREPHSDDGNGDQSNETDGSDDENRTQMRIVESVVRKKLSARNKKRKVKAKKSKYTWDAVAEKVTKRGSKERAICELCGAFFKDASTLRNHMALHGIGPKVHKCGICGKFTQSETALREHTITHTKEKPFICQFCSNSYASKSSLNGHIRRSHTRDNLRYCTQCPRGFASTTELRKHEMRHQGGVFKCPVCGFGCVVESQLIRHKFNKHGVGSMFLCDCGSSFAYRVHYEKHLCVHHSDLTPEQRGEKLNRPTIGPNEVSTGINSANIQDLG